MSKRAAGVSAHVGIAVFDRDAQRIPGGGLFDLRLGRSVGMAQRPVNQLVHIAQLLLGKTLRRSNIGQCRRRIRTGQIAEDKMRRSCSCAASPRDRRRRRARAR
ncbi:hypothetical protein I553_3656 [Mycobacterium xenopi 4042]|uniref:Uncharacterized protein n=1 Tax=Mycobacterium xenopi 4042 TaxID=1299334 RepID=X7ZYI4_MYCXE|nr:hypothetical protein I553_3656 [Mycobacterium xenopi 4042]